MKKLSEIKMSKKIVFAVIAAILSFWIAETILLALNLTGYTDVFIVSWFTFWSVELSALARIKITETRKSPYTKSEESRDEEIGG
jgi:hypothetical protein